MPKFSKDGLTVETSVATEAAELRRDGFIEQKYDNGGLLPSGPAFVTNDTGAPEVIKTHAKPAPNKTESK